MTKAQFDETVEKVYKEVKEESEKKLEKTGVVYLWEIYRMIFEKLGLRWDTSNNVYCKGTFTTTEEIAKCFR